MSKRVVCIVPLTVAVVSGCAPRWSYDYDEALTQARHRQRELLILYKDPLDTQSGEMRDVLEAPAVRALCEDKVHCMLVPYHAPSRRFVAQYGVFEAPAVIVVHLDGTYHTLTGVHSVEEVAAFLAAAKPPGREPDRSPQVPLRVTFSYFNVYERAVEAARNQNRPLLIVYKWWLDGESSELIQRLSRPHVARYFAESVRCILDWDYVPNRRHVARYGVTRYPALVIVEPNGDHRVLTGLHTDQEIIHFAVEGRRSDAASTAGGFGSAADR